MEKKGALKIETWDRHTLNKRRQHLAPSLQQRVPNHNLQKLLQPCPPVLNDIVAEAVGEDLAGQRRDRHAGTFALEDVAEIFKVGVTPADAALAELEGGDVCAAEDLVVGVHGASHAVCSRIPYLFAEEQEEEGISHALDNKFVSSLSTSFDPFPLLDISSRL